MAPGKSASPSHSKTAERDAEETRAHYANDLKKRLTCRREETTKVVPLTCHGHSRPVTHISFSAVTDDDQYYLISACKDNNPMLRDGATGDWIGTFIGHKGAVWQARLSSSAKLAATGSADFTAKVWDTHSGEALHTLQHSHIVRAVAFPASPSPTLLATGGMEKKLRVWDLARCGAASTAGSAVNPDADVCYEVGPGAHAGAIRSIIWSPTDPDVLVTAADDKTLRWWDLRTRAPVGSYTVDGALGSAELGTSSAPKSATANAAAEPESDGMLAVAAGKGVYFWERPTRPPGGFAPSRSHILPVEAAGVAVSASAGKFVTGGGGDTWVRVWGLEDAAQLEVGKGHHGPVWSVGFAPDEGLYGTGSEDGTVKLWKCRDGPYGLWR